jgi:hypothetical protein
MAARDAWLVRCPISFAKGVGGIRDAASADLEGEGAVSLKMWARESKAFLTRPIEGDWPYLWIDATYVKVRHGARRIYRGCGGVVPPHRKSGPYVVEGYHLPDPEMNPIDLLPKGVEIRANGTSGDAGRTIRMIA